jgi:hypothetical protein
MAALPAALDCRCFRASDLFETGRGRFNRLAAGLTYRLIAFGCRFIGFFSWQILESKHGRSQPQVSIFHRVRLGVDWN